MKLKDKAISTEMISNNSVGKFFQPSPKFVVTFVAISFGLLLLFGKDIRQFFADHFQPHITFQDASRQTRNRTEQNKQQTSNVIFDGEIYRTDERLREASAVAIAASITGIASFIERRPLQDVNQLLNSMKESGLLPPDLKLSEEGNVLLSQYSTIHIRFRPSPFAIEIVSLGRTRLDGSALILRLPDEKQNGKTESRYFYSLTLDGVKIPEPFSSPTKILSYGWQSAIFKPELPEGINSQELNRWAGEQR